MVLLGNSVCLWVAQKLKTRIHTKEIQPTPNDQVSEMVKITTQHQYPIMASHILRTERHYRQQSRTADVQGLAEASQTFCASELGCLKILGTRLTNCGTLITHPPPTLQSKAPIKKELYLFELLVSFDTKEMLTEKEKLA